MAGHQFGDGGAEVPEGTVAAGLLGPEVVFLAGVVGEPPIPGGGGGGVPGQGFAGGHLAVLGHQEQVSCLVAMDRDARLSPLPDDLAFASPEVEVLRLGQFGKNLPDGLRLGGRFDVCGPLQLEVIFKPGLYGLTEGGVVLGLKGSFDAQGQAPDFPAGPAYIEPEA